MPINKLACLPFRDTWAAPGSDMHKALSEGNKTKAKEIYERDQREQAEQTRLREMRSKERERLQQS